MSEVINLTAKVKTVKLGEYVISVKGKKPKRVSPVKTKECPVPYINIKAFEKNIIDEYTDGVGCALCNDGDFLMVWDGSRSGYVGKAIKGALGSTLVKLDFPDIDNNYAYYFLQSKFIEINTRAKGVGIPHVDPNILWNYDLRIPSRETQAAIVSKIEELFSELDNGIENLRIAQQQLKTYRQSVLKWAFEGKLTPDWRARNLQGSQVGIPTGTQKSKVVGSSPLSRTKTTKVPKVGIEPSDVPEERFELSLLPEGWEWMPMGEICEIKRGKSRNRPRNEPSLYGGKYPFIQTGDIRDANGGYIKAYTQTYSEKGLAQSKLWPKGTLCITIAANIGETAILGLDACFPDSVVGIVCDETALLVKYTNYYLISFKSKLDELAPATAQKNINVDILEKIRFPFAPIQEQHIIVDSIESRLSVADKLEETISQSLQQAEALRQSILKRAFEGKLISEPIVKETPTFKPKNPYFYQIQMLGYVLKVSKEKQVNHGEMTAAKYVYLLDRLYGVPSLYKFKRLHLGPYPVEMKKVINNKTYFKLADNTVEVLAADKLFKYNNPYQTQIESGVTDLANIFSKYPAKERSRQTELLATVCKVIEDIQTMDLAAVRVSMKDWPIDLKTTSFKNKAEKFTEAETEKCLAFIVKQGWDKKLMN